MMKKIAVGLVFNSIFTTSVFAQQTFDLPNGEVRFKTLCVSCHGEKGGGDGIAAQALSEKPSDIYEGLTSFWESERELIDTVMDGNEGMPAWKGMLTETDVKDIFAYIRKINE